MQYKMSFLEMQRLITGFTEPDASLCADVLKASLRSEEAVFQTRCSNSASSNIWIKEKGCTGSDDYDARDCDSMPCEKRYPFGSEHAPSSFSNFLRVCIEQTKQFN
jgi:hypothetical protein